MTVLSRSLAATACLFSLSAFSAVTVELHRDLAPVLINGEETGYRFATQRIIELEDGQNQLVLRVSKLIQKHSEFEKFYSYPAVLTFTASNKKISIRPAEIVRTQADAKAYKHNPQMVVTDASGQLLEAHQGVLLPGSGFMRDYAKELAAYNQQHAYLFGLQPDDTAEIDAEPGDAEISPLDMIRYWYAQATREVRQKFTDWALQSRKGELSEWPADSKASEMLGYWFSQASQQERRRILSWLMMQD